MTQKDKQKKPYTPNRIKVGRYRLSNWGKDSVLIEDLDLDIAGGFATAKLEAAIKEFFDKEF